MALNEHIEILRQGVDVWNRWRKEAPALPDLREANLRGADLRGIHLQDAHVGAAILRNADLRAADPLDTDPWGGPSPRSSFHAPYLLGGLGDTPALGGANRLWGSRQSPEKARANLWAAELWAANLEGANLRGADLRDCKLRGANLQHADLQDADLRGADLRDTNLWSTNLRCAILQETDLRSAKMGQTILSGLDLTVVRGLDTVQHLGPSAIDIDTLERTALGLAENASRREKIEHFYRRSGLNERVLLAIHNPTVGLLEYHSCFVSYSHADKAFARWLYDQLQSRGVRCWLHEHEALEDDDHFSMVDDSVRLHDRILFCCSKAAMSSWWVEGEIERALERERLLLKHRNQKVHTLIGLNLDGFLFEKKWKRARERQLKSRLVADFSGWQKKSAKLDLPLERVLQTLRMSSTPAPARD